MPKLKTLKDLKIKSNLTDTEIQSMLDHYDAEIMLLYNQGANDLHNDLCQAAREWIKELEEQKDKHYQMLNNTIGEEPSCEIPSGFDINECSVLPWGYDAKIDWIKYFFNLEDEDGGKT